MLFLITNSINKNTPILRIMLSPLSSSKWRSNILWKSYGYLRISISRKSITTCLSATYSWLNNSSIQPKTTRVKRLLFWSRVLAQYVQVFGLAQSVSMKTWKRAACFHLQTCVKKRIFLFWLWILIIIKIQIQAKEFLTIWVWPSMLAMSGISMLSHLTLMNFMLLLTQLEVGASQRSNYYSRKHFIKKLKRSLIQIVGLYLKANWRLKNKRTLWQTTQYTTAQAANLSVNHLMTRLKSTNMKLSAHLFLQDMTNTNIPLGIPSML